MVYALSVSDAQAIALGSEFRAMAREDAITSGTTCTTAAMKTRQVSNRPAKQHHRLGSNPKQEEWWLNWRSAIVVGVDAVKDPDQTSKFFTDWANYHPGTSFGKAIVL